MKIIIGFRKSVQKGGKVDQFEMVRSGTNNSNAIKNKILRAIRSNPEGNYSDSNEPVYDFYIKDELNKRIINSVDLSGETVGLIDENTLLKFEKDKSDNIFIKEVSNGINEESLPQEDSVKQLKKLRKDTKKTTIDDDMKKMLPYVENPIDKGVESYQEYQKRNSKKKYPNTIKSYENFINKGKVS